MDKKRKEREEMVPKSYPTNLLDKDWSKRRCFVRSGCTEHNARVHELPIREDDVWVVTLPKCGTTWMQELVWLVMHDFDFAAAKAEHQELRTPFLEFDFLVYADLERAFKPIEALKPPRLIKSHLPLPLLPAELWAKKPKVVYVYRNPKDAMVSEYYHSRSMGFSMDTTLDDYLCDFLANGAAQQLPFEHVTEFYALRNEPWVYYTSFERMKMDLRSVIEDICKFLDKPITQTQMQQMLHHLSFEEMKANPKTNHIWEFEQVREKHKMPYEKHRFVRKGKVGGYKEELSPATIAKMDDWIARELSSYGLTLNELLLLDA